MGKIKSKLKNILKNINYVLILRYVIYFGLLFLFLMILDTIFATFINHGNKGCENYFSAEYNFKLPMDFSIASFYYLIEVSQNKADICTMTFKMQYQFFLFFTILYLLFKSIGDRVVPVKKPWRRDISEVLLIVACRSWWILGILFTNNLLSLLPAMLLVLLSEIFYVFLLILIRRLVIKCGIKNPFFGALILYSVGFWILFLCFIFIFVFILTGP